MNEFYRVMFGACHLIGMSSAFSNPILYGWFNDAFREEFQNIARQGRILLVSLIMNKHEKIASFPYKRDVDRRPSVNQLVVGRSAPLSIMMEH